MELSNQQKLEFLETLWEQYRLHGRPDLPWRQPKQSGGFDPYQIMVSELMLQQTQVARVIPKYQAFLEQFPEVTDLAKASLGEVLRAWQGLGYNRRAKFLWQAAQAIAPLDRYPQTLPELVKLPGIGPNTAGAILAYSFSLPLIFIETNIRTVYLHHFFEGQMEVSDADILLLVEQTIDTENAREFYWALMDYGSQLKLDVGNLNKASKHYAKQSQFHGSRRQIRGRVIRLLSEGPQTARQLEDLIHDDRLQGVLHELYAEHLIKQSVSTYSLE